MIGMIILIYIIWAITSLIVCIVYDPEKLLNDFGKGLYIVFTLPWQLIAWIIEPIRRINFKIQKKLNDKRGKHSYGYKED